MKLSGQSWLIYNILYDKQWHCPIEWGYADGHCKRITDINRELEKQGEKIISEACDCGRHTSKILKRKIVSTEPLPEVQKGLF